MDICSHNPKNNIKKLEVLETDKEIFDWFLATGGKTALSNFMKSIWEQANKKNRVSAKQMRYVRGHYNQMSFIFNTTASKAPYGHEWQSVIIEDVKQECCQWCGTKKGNQ